MSRLTSWSAAPGHGPAVALVLAAACWGTGTVLSKVAVGVVPPVVLLPLQLAASLAVLVTLARLTGRPVSPAGVPRPLIALGILNPGLAYLLGLIGLREITASAAVIAWAIEPVLIAGLAWPLLGERLPASTLALSAASIGGIAVLAGDPGSGSTIAGLGITLVAVLCCAVYSVAVRRWIQADDGTVAVVVAQQAAALGVVLAVALAAGLGGPAVAGPVALSAAGLGSVVAIVASGVLYYGLAFWLYLEGLRRTPAPRAAIAFYLIPVFGLAAAAIAGERLEPQAWLGAAIVIGAVGGIGGLALRGSR